MFMKSEPQLLAVFSYCCLDLYTFPYTNVHFLPATVKYILRTIPLVPESASTATTAGSNTKGGGKFSGMLKVRVAGVKMGGLSLASTTMMVTVASPTKSVGESGPSIADTVNV